MDRAARAEDADKVRCYVMNGPFRRVLRRNGYFNVKSTLEVAVKINAVQVPRGFYEDTDGWHLTSGDAEGSAHAHVPHRLSLAPTSPPP